MESRIAASQQQTQKPADGNDRGDRGHDFQTIRMFSASTSVRRGHEFRAIIGIIHVAISLPAR